MSRLVKKTCDRCGTLNEFDLDELRGMPLRDAVGNVVEENPRIELDKPIFVECENGACKGPFIVTEEDL